LASFALETSCGSLARLRDIGRAEAACERLLCGGCWWTNETWMDICPRGFERPRRMSDAISRQGWCHRLRRRGGRCRSAQSGSCTPSHSVRGCRTKSPATTHRKQLQPFFRVRVTDIPPEDGSHIFPPLLRSRQLQRCATPGA
jgi:hypothetical protein